MPPLCRLGVRDDSAAPVVTPLPFAAAVALDHASGMRRWALSFLLGAETREQLRGIAQSRGLCLEAALALAVRELAGASK